AVTYIMEHYNETVPLEALSKIACLSVFHFSRIFKQTFDLTPHQFQIRYRIEKSKELMMFNRLSLSTIAEKVGYGNVYSFSKAFKQTEGMSPRQFMRTNSKST
ncbi:MAG: AraC family transcriptional regulator, partial [Paenibacillus sp.]